jgi:hypothetical protein
MTRQLKYSDDNDSSSDEELYFTTHGTSIDEAYGGDVDEVESDDYSEGKFEE